MSPRPLSEREREAHHLNALDSAISQLGADPDDAAVLGAMRYFMFMCECPIKSVRAKAMEVVRRSLRRPNGQEEAKLLELLRRDGACFYLSIRVRDGAWMVALHDRTAEDEEVWIGDGRSFAEAWRNRAPPGGNTLN